MDNYQSAKDRIRQFVLENFVFEDNSSDLQDSDSFLENGIIDSTGVLELVLFVEETFGIDVADEEVVPENFDSVKALGAYVSRKISTAVGTH